MGMFNGETRGNYDKKSSLNISLFLEQLISHTELEFLSGACTEDFRVSLLSLS